MSFDPQKFFIGLIDFFSILLPGALLTYLLMDDVGPVVLGGGYSHLAGARAWAAFLFASYLLGHLIFLAGSWLDELYDWVRRNTLNTQIEALARRGRKVAWPMRLVAWLVFKRERNLALNRVLELRRKMLEPLHAEQSINVFQWCKAVLTLESPASLSVVQRLEADSKFFRCLAVVLVVLLAIWPFEGPRTASGVLIVLALLVLALWRFMEQRFKATNQAYWSVITLTAKQGKVVLDPPPSSADGPTHAGGVVFRKRWGARQYLVLEASKDPAQWVLPKGHIEPTESMREAAVREVLEETGVWARIVADLGSVSYTVGRDVVNVRFYAMSAVGRGPRKDRKRRHRWLPLAEAVTCVSHLENRELLKTAEQRTRTV